MAGLALLGNGCGWDLNIKIGSAVSTTTLANTETSQYKVAFVQQSTTTDDYSADYLVTTTMVPVGVIQSWQTAGSTHMDVRVAGVTKCYAGDSILAGSPVTWYSKTAGAAESGYVTYLTPTGDLTGSVASKRVMGIALSGAQKTGAALSVLLIPSIAW